MTKRISRQEAQRILVLAQNYSTPAPVFDETEVWLTFVRQHPNKALITLAREAVALRNKVSRFDSRIKSFQLLPRTMINGLRDLIGERRRQELQNQYDSMEKAIQAGAAYQQYLLTAKQQYDAALQKHIRRLAVARTARKLKPLLNQVDFIECEGDDAESILRALEMGVTQRTSPQAVTNPVPQSEKPHTLPVSRRPCVALDSDLPDYLFEPRSIDALHDIDPIFGDRFYLLTDDMEQCQQLGAEIDQSGAYMSLEASSKWAELDPYLPHVAKRVIKPLLGDMIPSSSWGSSLANLLTKTSWDELRATTFIQYGNRCEICGSSSDLECHEYWEYHEPIIEGHFGIQRLVRLMALCSDCHDVHHLGLMNVQGRLKWALDRLGAINRWTESEIKDYYRFVGGRFERRSEYPWALDLSIIGDTLLRVKGSWKLQEGGTILGKTATGETETLLLGVQWRFAREETIHEAINAQDAYFE